MLAGLVYVVVSFIMNKIMFSIFQKLAEIGCMSFTVVQRMPKILFAFLALLGLWLIFLWSAFGTDRSFALWMDNEFFTGTVLSSMSATLSHGEWPLRMDTILGGVPLYNFAQLSPFYPFYLAALPIYKGPLAVIYSMHWITLMHILILEINMYIFIRVIGATRLAALAGAALVAFSANSFSYAVWLNIVAPYSWFPLYLAGLVGILKCPRSMRYSSMALGGIVLLTQGSPAQPLIHAVFVTIIFVLACCGDQLRRGKVGHVTYALGRVVVVGLLALLLVSPVILPVALEFRNMIRWLGPFPAIIGNARIPFEAFQIDQLSIADLSGVFFKFKSAAVGSQYVGVLSVALASVAMASSLRSWIVIALVFIAVYSLISSTGSNLGLAYVNYIVPMLNKIREPSRFLVLFQFAVGVLAALGIDELRKTVMRKNSQAEVKRQGLALVLISLIAVIVILIIRERIVSDSSPIVAIAILAVLTLLTWIATRSSLRGRDTMVAVLWGGAALTLLAIEVPWIPPPVSSSQYLTSGALALDKAIERVVTLDPGHEYRVIFDGKIDKQQAAMLASYRGVRTFNSYFNPAPQRQFEELYYHGPRADNYFRILGAKYLICSECTAASLRGYKYLESTAGYDIYETEDVLPHSYIVNQLNGEFLNLADFVTKAASADLSKMLLFVEPNVVVGLNGGKDNAGNACISREEIRTTNRSRYVVQCKAPGVLVLNEFFDDAWRITVDGVKIQSLRVNGNQIGGPFPPGSHVIEFRYLPTIFLVSLGMAFVGVMFLIYLTVVRKSTKVTDEQ